MTYRLNHTEGYLLSQINVLEVFGQFEFIKIILLQECPGQMYHQENIY